MPVRLSPLEAVSGLVVGADPDAAPLPRPGEAPAPVAALERALVAALKHPPCLVSFSGGRDSSALLALAVHAARREGLELPVPITVRFTGDADSDESDWQELLIAELGIADWQRINAGDELGVLGAVARSSLERQGLLWPPNVHVLAPLLEAAAGGTLVTGVGGDELFDLPGRLALLPAFARRAAERRRGPLDLPWLRPQGRAALEEALAAQRAEEPAGWRKRVHWISAQRQVSVLRASAASLAATAGAELAVPLLDAGFLASLAAHGTRRAYGTRDAAMATLFTGLLPARILERSTKARFNRALWGEEARQFARNWRGAGLDGDLVDAGRLRRAWAEESPDFRSATALQAAWLAQERSTLSAAGVRQRDQKQPR